MQLEPKKRSSPRTISATIAGLVSGALLAYGSLNGISALDSALDQPHAQVIPNLAAILGFFMLMSVPAIIWRKDLLLVGLGLLAAIILFATIAAS